MDSNCAIRPALGVEVAARLGDLSICWTWVVVASHLLIHQPRGLSTAARQKPGSSTARNPSEDYPNCQFFFAPPQPRLFVRPSPPPPTSPAGSPRSLLSNSSLPASHRRCRVFTTVDTSRRGCVRISAITQDTTSGRRRLSRLHLIQPSAGNVVLLLGLAMTVLFFVNKYENLNDRPRKHSLRVRTSAMADENPKSGTKLLQTRALRERKLRQGQNANRKWFGFLILILIRMSTGSLPKCCGFIALSASVISPSFVQIVQWLFEKM